MRYKVIITKTSDGRQEYLQVISEDQFTTNIVLIGQFELKDAREPQPSRHHRRPTNRIARIPF